MNTAKLTFALQAYDRIRARPRSPESAFIIVCGHAKLTARETESLRRTIIARDTGDVGIFGALQPHPLDRACIAGNKTEVTGIVTNRPDQGQKVTIPVIVQGNIWD